MLIKVSCISISPQEDDYKIWDNVSLEYNYWAIILLYSPYANFIICCMNNFIDYLTGCMNSLYEWLNLFLSFKAFRGGSRTDTHQTPTSLFENIFGVVFVNFDCITSIFFNCSKHAMCTIPGMYFILKFNYKTIGCVLRGNKTIPRPPEFYPPPLLTFIVCMNDFTPAFIACMNDFILYLNSLFPTVIAWMNDFILPKSFYNTKGRDRFHWAATPLKPH